MRAQELLAAGLVAGLAVACNQSSQCGGDNNGDHSGVDFMPPIDVTVVDSVRGTPLCTPSGVVECGIPSSSCVVTCMAQGGPTGTFSEIVAVSAPGYRIGSASVSVTVGCTSGSAGTATLRLVAECSMPVIHDNGVGQTWTDCTAPYTYDQAEATVACGYYPAAEACTTAMDCPLVGDAGDSVAVCSAQKNAPGACVCWNYQGPGAGHVRSSSAGCECATEGDPYWD